MSALGERLSPGEPARIAAALAALPEDDEDGIETPIALTGRLQACFVQEDALLQVELLLEGEREARAEAVVGALEPCAVDPLAA